jgi:hypothetical protein
VRHDVHQDIDRGRPAGDDKGLNDLDRDGDERSDRRRPRKQNGIVAPAT